MHKLISINSADFSELKANIPESYDPERVVKLLSAAASPAVRAVLFEYPYVDKDYRSTYYNFYSKKLKTYSPHCIRLHFFLEGISVSNDFHVQPSDDADLSSLYIGFMVLRPTSVLTIGRTALSPLFLKAFSGHVMLAEHKVHLLGRRIHVKGFPWMEQHADIAVCAHVACWSVLRYYRERFGGYREFLVHDMALMSSPYDQGGLLPSRGLYVGQAVRILSEGGTYPDTYKASSFGESFHRYLYAYIESGFPVFAAMHGRKHAITIVGHGPIVPGSLKSAKPAKGIRFSWDAIQTLVAVDDNKMPYFVLANGNGDKDSYGVQAIDTFVVPLPDKVYLPAEAVEKHALNILEKSPWRLDFSVIKQCVIRYFLTSSSSMRKWVSDTADDHPSNLRVALMDLPLPHFVWVVEIGGLTSWDQKRCNMRFLFDATASAREKMPFILIHDASSIVIHDRAFGDRPPVKIPIGNLPEKEIGAPLSMRLFDRNLQAFP